jgi:DNA-binding transcriptional LysR family regulator
MHSAHVNVSIRRMEVLELRSFREVCRQGSISAAARSLQYTQGAVSRQIAGLEARLGTPLLERRHRGVRPTPAGQVLLEHAIAILGRIDRATEEVRAAEQAQSTRLRVGAVPTAAAVLLPRALTDFRAQRPGVRVTFVEGVTPRLLPMLAEGEIDVAVVTDYPPGLPSSPGVELVHLLDDALRCALPSGHRLARHRRRIELAELADEVWVEDYAGAAAILTSAAARAGFTPRIEIECGGWLGKQAFVAAGFGITLVPGLLVPALRPDLVVKTLADPPVRAVHAAVPGSGTAPAAEFVAALATTARLVNRSHAGRVIT